MDESTSGKKVRIVTGLQQGAEFVLGTEENCVIGSDASCWAVLLDDKVAPRHCALSVDDFGMTCTPLDDEVRIGSMKLSPGRTVKIVDFQVISVGSASLMVGPKDGDWEKGLVATASQILQRSPINRLSLGNRLIAGVAITATVLIGGLGFAYAMISSDQTEMTESNMRDAERWLKSIAPVGSELRLAVDNRQHLSVLGYVNTKYQRELLVMPIHESKYKPRSEIYATEELVSSMQRLSKLENLPCIAVDVGGGKVKCTNVVGAEEIATKLKLIAQQIPGLRNLDVSVEPVKVTTPSEPTQIATQEGPVQQRSDQPLRFSKKFNSVVISKKHKWLIGEFGEKYAEGDVFNGTKIIKIDFDQVEFERDDKHYIFPIAALK